MLGKVAALFAGLRSGSVPKAWRPVVLLAGVLILFTGIVILCVSSWREPLGGDLLAAAGMIIVTGLLVLWTGSDND